MPRRTSGEKKKRKARKKIEEQEGGTSPEQPIWMGG